MSTLVVALVLFGCADDGTMCERLSAQPRYFSSRVLCETEVDTALQSDIALRADYPVVMARCISSNALVSHDKSDARQLARRDGGSLYSR